jgi:hypothetical protein
MRFRNIGINDEAYARLKQFELPGDSFSAVILRELPEPCKTAGEIESYFSMGCKRPIPSCGEPCWLDAGAVSPANDCRHDVPLRLSESM